MAKSDIESLRTDIEDLKARVARLETAKPIEPAEPPIVEADPALSEAPPTPVGPIIMIIIGALLTFTIIGAIIGIPLLIAGIVQLNRSTAKHESTHDENAAAAHEPQMREANIESDTPEAIEPEPSPVQPEAPIQPEAPREPRTLDSNLVLRALTIIGVVALVIGGVFFLTLSIQNEWLSKPVQIIIGIIAGLAVALGGSYMRFKHEYPFWGDMVSTGGAIIVYFTIYAAYALEPYRLALGVSAAVLGIGLMLVAAVLLAYAAGIASRTITLAAILLGKLTFLFAEATIISLIYIAVLAIGARSVSSIHKWTHLSIAALVLGGIGTFIAGIQVDPLSAIIALAITIGVSEALTLRRDENAYLLGLVPTAAYGLIILPLASELGWNLGITSMIIAAALIGSSALHTGPARITRAISASIFLVIGSGLLASPGYIGLTWAALALALAYTANRFSDTPLRVTSMIIAGFGYLAVLMDNLPSVLRSDAVLALPAFYVVVLTAAAYYLLSRENEGAASQVFSALSTLMLVLLTYAAAPNAAVIIGVFAALALIFRIVLSDSFSHLQSLVLSALMTLTLIIADASGWARADTVLTLSYAIATAALIALNTYTRRLELSESESWVIPVGVGLITAIGTRFIVIIAPTHLVTIGWLAFGLAGVVLSSFATDRFMRICGLAVIALAVLNALFETFDARFFALVIVGITALITYVRMYELENWITNAGVIVTTMLVVRFVTGIASGAGITLGWLGAGVVGLVIGISLSDRFTRICGLVLIGLAVLKAFFFDVFELELVWRVIAFIVLGIALLASALLYGKYRERIGELF